MRTMSNSLREGSLIRKTQEMSSMATGVKACVGKVEVNEVWDRGQHIIRREK